ncbi:adenylate/guanylate cyclase domain-containing protein [Thermogemmatispora sp.]|uniref:adenylate/guanylate cyclase domain-containing protein n=1 Tax=Thermogemmatispora sp. TaxID=1968838 RepID=UPI001DBB062F|nr:adenylate/guanylate cyclase domain-containing protein [Thermogemmatispora sp.]MBX5451182.1 AAA family ATPase [Thermogemmatispora sp.]
MLRCPHCQTTNPPHAKFCLACGLRFLICPYCGTANPPVARYCIECGRAQGQKGRWPEGADALSLPAPAVSRQEETWLESSSGLPVSVDPEKSALERPAEQRPMLSTPEERRVVTVMFADITGSTPLADRLDPEDLRAILAGYFNLMTEQIRRHGGTVEKYIGDAVMAVFGLPQAHEDDPDRAIRAALDMQTALARFNEARRERDPEAVPLQMRIGINTGEVAAPRFDGSLARRGDFLVTGDAVNIAARLQQVAGPDTILVGERTYLATRETFHFRPLAPLQLKGKGEAMRAWVVLGLAEEQPVSALAARARRGLLAPLIGRSLELTLMHATYARVLAERQPHLITLLGPSGIGKSRLVHEFIEREQEKARSTTGPDQAPAPLVMYGRCPPYGEGITYWPLIEILRALLQVQYNESDEDIHRRFTVFVSEVLERAGHKEDAAGVAEAILLSVGRQLGASARLSGGERRERQRMAYARNLEQSGTQMTLLRSWRILLAALAQQQPLILVIDDLQWADEALLDLLEYLMERLNNAPLLLLCPARPEFLERRQDWGGGQRNFTTIVLEALSPEESKELVRALLKNSELPEALCHTILSRAEGNPFFVEELVRMFIDQGILVYEQDSWRVAREKEHLLSELASPAGPPDDALLDLHYTLPLPRVPDTIQGVLAARVDLLSPVEKHVLQKAALIGRTFWLAGLRELTADLDEETLLQILESLITRDFISESERRDRSPVENDRVFSFKHILTRDVVYHTLPRSHRAVSHARLARWLEEQTAGRTDRFVELLAYHYQQAATNWTHSLRAGFAAEQVEPELSLQELRERATVYLTKAGDQALRSYYTIRAIQAYSDALELLRESGGEGRVLARMHEKLGDAFTQRANLREAWQAYRQALQLLEAEPEPPSADLLYLYDSLAELATRWGPWHDTPPDMDEVRSYIDAGLALAKDKGDRAVFLTYLALWYMHRGAEDSNDVNERARRAEQALQSAREARRLAEEAQDVEALWLALDALGGIYVKLCDYAEAHRTQHQRQQLQAQITRQQGRQDRQELHDLYYSLGWVHFFICDYPTAARWFGEAWQVAQTMESPSLLLLSMLGRIHVWYDWDRWDDAREAAQKALLLIEQYQLEEMWEIDALKHLVMIAFQTGDYEQGERYLRRLKLLGEQVTSRLLRLDLEFVLQLSGEEWSNAAETLKEEVRHHEPFVRPEQQALLAELLTRTEAAVEEQAKWCERALVAARRSRALKAEGRALRAQGRLALTLQRWEEARSCLQQALALFERLDLPWERGQTLYCLGELYRRQAASAQLPEAAGHWRELARHSLSQALGFFRALHAVRDIERANSALQAL